MDSEPLGLATFSVSRVNQLRSGDSTQAPCTPSARATSERHPAGWTRVYGRKAAAHEARERELERQRSDR